MYCDDPAHLQDKTQILGMALYLAAVNDVLIEFCDKGKGDGKFGPIVKSIAEFIAILGADFSKKLRKRYDTLSQTQRFHYGFHENNKPQIHYVHYDVFRRFIEGRHYKKRVYEFVSKLRSLTNRRFKAETRKTNAELCLEFLGQFQATCLYEFDNYVPSIPKGIHKLLTKNQP